MTQPPPPLPPAEMQPQGWEVAGDPPPYALAAPTSTPSLPSLGGDGGSGGNGSWAPHSQGSHPPQANPNASPPPKGGGGTAPSLGAPSQVHYGDYHRSPAHHGPPRQYMSHTPQHMMHPPPGGHYPPQHQQQQHHAPGMMGPPGTPTYIRGYSSHPAPAPMGMVAGGYHPGPAAAAPGPAHHPSYPHGYGYPPPAPVESSGGGSPAPAPAPALSGQGLKTPPSKAGAAPAPSPASGPGPSPPSLVPPPPPASGVSLQPSPPRAQAPPPPGPKEEQGHSPDAASILLGMKSSKARRSDMYTSTINKDWIGLLPTRLATHEDAKELNSLHCFVRSTLLELFVTPIGKFDDQYQNPLNPGEIQHHSVALGTRPKPSPVGVAGGISDAVNNGTVAAVGPVAKVSPSPARAPSSSSAAAYLTPARAGPTGMPVEAEPVPSSGHAGLKTPASGDGSDSGDAAALNRRVAPEKESAVKVDEGVESSTKEESEEGGEESENTREKGKDEDKVCKLDGEPTGDGDRDKSPYKIPPPSFLRVGFRCTFCAREQRERAMRFSQNSPPALRGGAPMSTFYPKSLAEIYNLVNRWQRVHFRKCKHVPPSVRHTFDEHKVTDKSRGRREYWVQSARSIGLFDDEKHGRGIRFIPPARGSQRAISGSLEGGFHSVPLHHMGAPTQPHQMMPPPPAPGAYIGPAYSTPSRFGGPHYAPPSAYQQGQPPPGMQVGSPPPSGVSPMHVQYAPGMVGGSPPGRAPFATPGMPPVPSPAFPTPSPGVPSVPGPALSTAEI